MYLYLFQQSYSLSIQLPLTQTSNNLFCLAATFDCFHGTGGENYKIQFVKKQKQNKTNKTSNELTAKPKKS